MYICTCSGRQTDAPAPLMSTSQLLEPVNVPPDLAKGTCRCDEARVLMGNDPGLSCWPHVTTGVPLRERWTQCLLGDTCDGQTRPCMRRAPKQQLSHRLSDGPLPSGSSWSLARSLSSVGTLSPCGGTSLLPSPSDINCHFLQRHGKHPNCVDGGDSLFTASSHLSQCGLNLAGAQETHVELTGILWGLQPDGHLLWEGRERLSSPLTS